MKTLTQHLIDKVFVVSGDISLNNAKEAVEAWLTEHKNDIGNQIYSDHREVAETVFNVLLEELKQK